MSLAVHEPVSTASPRKLRAWIPTLLWLCVLVLFSTDTFSAEHTGSVLLRILHAMFGSRFDEQFEQIHFLIRKSAHFCSYGFLGALAFFSWRTTLPARPRWTLRWSLLALLIATTAGSLDELHQIFVPSRTASPRDVLIDTMGGIFFQLVIALWIVWQDKRTAP
ncbi:MAG TPA: VanZ family protein [Candidatus Binatia bacterium]|nr:VanZ family protein [Candidatus Binatia bacterium]